MGALKPVGTALPEIAAEVAKGLCEQPKSLPAWLLYDAEGSRLFEQITTLPEYYLTRCEREILETYAGEILESTGSNLTLLELGAGTATKTGILIRALLQRQLQVRFYPVDVCEDALQIARQSLAAISPQVKVQPIVADYTCEFDGLAEISGRKLALYLGSSIGNFELENAATVLRRLRSQLRTGDALLLGTDLRKSAALLVPAYNDTRGVTARFNKNLLARINHELGAHFDLRTFRHLALWNRARSRMEMYLESMRSQQVTIDLLELDLNFAAGERIHTENSYKYTPTQVRSLLHEGGFEWEHTWTDRRGWFALNLAKAR